uniref:Uncharacterized protein n=1 Tax=Panagrolaimus superbus TaxID=310955 RepID=A0A914Z4E7_9BILA
MNTKVNPCENFYEFACGSYNGIKQVPESEKKITLFTESRTRLKYEIRELIDDTSLRDSGNNNNNKSISDISKLVYIYYDSCMDDQAQDLLDLMPIFSLISSFGGWALLQNAKFEERDFSWEILETNLQIIGINGLFKFTIKQSMPITISNSGAANGAGYLIVSQPQLLLGDRKYYSNSLGKNEFLQNYRTYMMDLLELFGADSEASEPQLNNVLNFERKVANVSLFFCYGTLRLEKNEILLCVTITDNKFLVTITTPSSKLVKVNIQTLKSKFPKIIWKNIFNNEFFNLLPGFTESNLPLLVDMEYLQQLQVILSTTDSQTINDYLMWKLLSSFNAYLPQRYRIPHETITSVLKGQTIKPLWEECINEVIERLPIPMITIYNRLFNGGRYSKIERIEIEQIIKDLKEALSQIILNIDWMDEETRGAATEKLKHLKVNFNILKNFQSHTFENEILTQFNGLKLIGNTYFENTISIRKLQQKNEFKKLNSSNFLNNFSSLTFEAFIELIPFNLYQTNEIILPTSLLQFPFYVLNAPNSINYGSIGAIISRELTHNFDDYGANFDEKGARKNWWKKDTIKFFDSKKQCFIAQYNNKADSISGKKVGDVQK